MEETPLLLSLRFRTFSERVLQLKFAKTPGLSLDLLRGAKITQKIERKPWGTLDFRLKDTFGNELKFTEPQAEE